MKGKNALFDMIFIKCNCVSTRWQWSVNLFTDRKEITRIRRNKTQNNTKTQNAQNRKLQKKTNSKQ